MNKEMSQSLLEVTNNNNRSKSETPSKAFALNSGGGGKGARKTLKIYIYDGQTKSDD